VRRVDYADIAARYKAGQTRSQIYAETGCHPNTIVKILKETGVPLRDDRKNRERTLDYDLIRRLYVEEQKTMPVIAAEIGSRAESVRGALLTMGVTLRDDRSRNGGGPRASTAVLHAQIMVTVATGVTYIEAARIHGVSERTVKRAVAKHNAEARPAAQAS
jgi:predicted transcriptional regulator